MSNSLNLPNSWSEITYNQYIELIELDKEELSFFTKHIEVLAIITDTTSDDDIWQEMDVEEIANIIKGLKWLRYPPSNYKKEILKYHFKSLNNLTLGEFIDLEYYFSDDYKKNLPIICSVLYRNKMVDVWGNEIIEEYSFIDINKRAEEFKMVSIDSVFGVIEEYLKFKKDFHDNYAKHFEPEYDEDEEDIQNSELFSPEEKEELLKEKEEEKKKTKWGWENILYKLSNGDITKYDAILKLPLIFVFNQLSYMRDNNI
jgi:hypothetical protein